MSTSRILYKSDFYEIKTDGAAQIIRTDWLRPVTRDEMIEGGTKLHDVLLETQYKKVLANAQKLESLDMETKEWMSTKFYELLSETPLKKIARVLPGNLFFQLALESVATRAEALGVVKFQFKNFQQDAPAYRWLED